MEVILERNNLQNIDIDAILNEDKKKAIEIPEELKFLNRMKRGNVSLACAKTGVGKSMFLRQFGCCMARNYMVLYISLENDTATDMEHLKVLRDMYDPQNFYYVKKEIWRSNKVAKDDFRSFDIVCIDGLETSVVMGDNESSFEVYKNEVNAIKAFFDSSCVWLSWQMGRQFAKDEPTIEDIAFSYAAARLAYSAVAVYWKHDVRYIKNIKGRGGNIREEGQLEWGKHFTMDKILYDSSFDSSDESAFS